MRELALHLLDLAANALQAKAGIIAVRLRLDSTADRLTLIVADDGTGMDPDLARSACDPFVTTRRGRPVGLGLALLSAAAERCGGFVRIRSAAGRGTSVCAAFGLSHPDRAPIGNLAGTMHVLMVSNPLLDFSVGVRRAACSGTLDTRPMRARMPMLRLDEPLVSGWLLERLCFLFPPRLAAI